MYTLGIHSVMEILPQRSYLMSAVCISDSHDDRWQKVWTAACEGHMTSILRCHCSQTTVEIKNVNHKAGILTYMELRCNIATWNVYLGIIGLFSPSQVSISDEKQLALSTAITKTCVLENVSIYTPLLTLSTQMQLLKRIHSSDC